MLQTARVLAKELGAQPYMQPPYVADRVREDLAMSAALNVVVGLCTVQDYEEWGWAESTQVGRAGEYFTYCDNGGQPQIVYETPG